MGFENNTWEWPNLPEGFLPLMLGQLQVMFTMSNTHTSLNLVTQEQANFTRVIKYSKKENPSLFSSYKCGLHGSINILHVHSSKLSWYKHLCLPLISNSGHVTKSMPRNWERGYWGIYFKSVFMDYIEEVTKESKTLWTSIKSWRLFYSLNILVRQLKYAVFSKFHYIH